MQNKKNNYELKSRYEFGDKNNLDTGQKLAQFGLEKNFWRMKPPLPARNHCCLS